jgi:hypothetical protein
MAVTEAHFLAIFFCPEKAINISILRNLGRVYGKIMADAAIGQTGAASGW